MKLIINIDGGARGNPGPAGAGVVIRSDDGQTLGQFGVFIGHATNNVAEYTGLLEALKRAGELQANELEIRSDSQLLVRQMIGQYRVKNEGLIPLFRQAGQMASKFQRCVYVHVPREQNKDADRMANRAMDLKRNVDE